MLNRCDSNFAYPPKYPSKPAMIANTPVSQMAKIGAATPKPKISVSTLGGWIPPVHISRMINIGGNTMIRTPSPRSISAPPSVATNRFTVVPKVMIAFTKAW